MNLGMSGFLGGEGIIFQKFTGNGRVFITAGGDLKQKPLQVNKF
ncbi:MAG: AIM24 family protein [Pleurocapsa sp.]